MSDRLPLNELMGWESRRGTRPRLRVIARGLERVAYWLYPEATYTVRIITGGETRTFIDCRECRE